MITIEVSFSSHNADETWTLCVKDKDEMEDLMASVDSMGDPANDTHIANFLRRFRDRTLEHYQRNYTEKNDALW